MEAAKDLIFILAVLQISVRKKALARFEAKRSARRGQRTHSDQAAVSKHQISPCKADELAVRFQLVRRHLTIVCENAVHRLDGVKLAAVVGVHVHGLAILTFFACIHLLRNLLPLLHGAPHEAAT